MLHPDAEEFPKTFADAKNSGDKLHKIRELFEYFIGAYRHNYMPGQETSLDESMKKSKGRCVFKQY